MGRDHDDDDPVGPLGRGAGVEMLEDPEELGEGRAHVDLAWGGAK